MKSYKKRGSIKAVKFVKKEYLDLIANPEKVSDSSSELQALLKRVKKTQNGYFCASSAGMRPISDGSWLCYDQGRVFTMSDKDFLIKFEESSGPDGEHLDQIQDLTERLDDANKEILRLTTT